jgi:nicotinic acid phosphoribosyltransferase
MEIMIIESLLDTDLYKFTMMQCVLHQFPGAEVKYRFSRKTGDRLHKSGADDTVGRRSTATAVRQRFVKGKSRT